MKTYHIKDLLKKDLLVLELARLEYYEVLKDGIYIKDHESGERDFIKGSYTLLGKPDEIKEEDAMELVHKNELGYTNYNAKTASQAVFSKFPTATESLLSALESEIFWENPYEIPGSDDINWYRNQINGDFSERYTRVFNWYDNQSRTFDRTRSLIFKKNK